MAMRDGYTVHAGPRGPLVTITTAGGLVHTCSTTAELAPYLARPGRWPGLAGRWQAASPQELVTTPAALQAALPRKEA